MSFRFSNESIPRLIVSLAAPSVAAQLVNALYSVIDRMFVGRLPGTGTLALTGVGLAFPIAMIVSSFAALIGFGGAPLASIKMGEGKREEAERLLGNCLAMLLYASVALTVLFLALKKQMLILFGASSETLPFANDFMGIYLFGTVAVLLSVGLNSFIAIQGYAKTAMATVCLGAAINLALDPVFIFSMNMGVKGAALATVIAQAVSAVWVLAFLRSKRSHLRLRLRTMRLSPGIVFGVLALGVSPFIMQATESLVQIVLNASMARYGGDLYVAAMGIMGTLMQTFTLLLQSFAQGAQPIVGFNYGAGDYGRVKSAIRYCSVFCGLLGLIMWAILIFLPRLPALAFTGQEELISLTARLMRIFFMGTCIYGLQLAFQQIFIALGQAKVSIFIATLRKLILLIPLVYALPELFQPKAVAIVAAEPVADFCAASTCCVLFALKVRKLLTR